MRTRNPLDILTNCNTFFMLGTLSQGAIIKCFMTYYRAGCPPIENPEWEIIAGLRSNDWIRHRNNIMLVLNEIIPTLRAWKIKDDARAEMFTDRLRKANKARSDTLKAHKEPKTAKLSDKSKIHTAVTPTKITFERDNAEFSDIAARSQVIAAKKNKPVDVKPGLKDK